MLKNISDFSLSLFCSFSGRVDRIQTTTDAKGTRKETFTPDFISVLFEFANHVHEVYFLKERKHLSGWWAYRLFLFSFLYISVLKKSHKCYFLKLHFENTT